MEIKKPKSFDVKTTVIRIDFRCPHCNVLITASDFSSSIIAVSCPSCKNGIDVRDIQKVICRSSTLSYPYKGETCYD